MESFKGKPINDKTPIEKFLYRYLPYWPLFTILIILAGGVSYGYLKYFAKPVYEVSAKVMVDDQKKGADESKILEALNISANTIVDNEIEVIQSKELLRQVVDSLHLYAPVYRKGTFTNYSAYETSPVMVSVLNPGSIDGAEPVFFSYNANNKTVRVDAEVYPLDLWVRTRIGTVKFNLNNHYKQSSKAGPFFFTVKNPQELVDNLYGRILVTPASKLSSVILISLNDEVPSRGQDIVNGLINAYYHSAINSKNDLAENTLSFVQKRIQSVSKELDSIENKLQQFKNEKGAIDLSEQGKLYLQNVGENDRKTTDIDMQVAMLEQVEKYVLNKDDQIGIVPSISGIKGQELLSQLLQKLYDSQMQYERLKKTVPAGNPTMFSLKNEIDNIRPTILENIRNQKSSLIAGRNTLSAGTGKYLSLLNSIPGKEKQLLDISRQQAIKNDAYSFLLQKREETALAYSSIVNNSKTISHATASFNPVGPKKSFIFSASMAAALLLGFVFVNFKESGTNKVMFREDIERITSIPIVGELMSLKGKAPFLLTSTNINHLGPIEQIRQLRYAMGLNSRIQKYKKLLVTSSQASEGKSFISNNLALSLTSCNKKVVLIDFDFRNPKTSAMFNLQGQPGLSELFESDGITFNDIIYPSDQDQLFVIPAGAWVSNPTELLLKKDLDKLFQYLENEFDFIVMDTAPVDPVIDASVISEYCDAVLFVIRHGHSNKAALEALQNSHRMNSLRNNMFIVFNGVKSRGFLNNKYGYGYGYGSNSVYANGMYQIPKPRALVRNS